MRVPHFLSDVVPHDVLDWKLEANRILGRTVCTARRYGVTIMYVAEDGWWTVTKMAGGKILQQKQCKQLPSQLERRIDELRRASRQVA